MLNNVVLVGRIVNKKENHFQLSIARAYKNKEGKYDNDIITVYMNGKIAENMNQYCEKGSIVGVKGHLEQGNIIMADKITFLSTNSKEK